jgi:hypothetical protein
MPVPTCESAGGLPPGPVVLVNLKQAQGPAAAPQRHSDSPDSELRRRWSALAHGRRRQATEAWGPEAPFLNAGTTQAARDPPMSSLQVYGEPARVRQARLSQRPGPPGRSRDSTVVTLSVHSVVCAGFWLSMRYFRPYGGLTSAVNLKLLGVTGIMIKPKPAHWHVVSGLTTQQPELR